MSEPKRANLTSICTTKKPKKLKLCSKTRRFKLTLTDPDEEACSEFNYSSLLSSAERKRKLQLKAEGRVNGVNSIPDEGGDRVQHIARQLEAKYGGSGKSRHGRFQDYVDLGAGYDESDPFIDNTDAYDEVVPEEMTTLHGGFYINCGQLEFKEVSDQSDVEESKETKFKKKVNRVTIVEEEEEAAPKLSPKEEEEAKNTLTNNEVDDEEVVVKKRKIEKPEVTREIHKEKRVHYHDNDIVKKKKKRAIDGLIKKKSATVKELLKERREVLQMDQLNDSNINDSGNKSPVLPSPKTMSASILDVIESVVSAARDNESTKDSVSTGTKSGSGSAELTDSEDSQQGGDIDSVTGGSTLEVSLPEELPEDIKDMVTALKNIAQSSGETNKNKFFSSEVNQVLLSFEQRCRKRLSPSHRQQVYGYLSNYVPCSKITLMNRAKKLVVEQHSIRLKDLIKRLKNSIDSMMPSILENYTKECQKAAEEKNIEEPPSSDDEMKKDDESPKKSRTKIPRKKFPWSNDLKMLFCEIVRLKRMCLELLRPRKETVDDCLKSFLETEMVVLWPPGWMRASVLIRQIKSNQLQSILKNKKQKPTLMKKPTSSSPVGNSLSSTVGNCIAEAISSGLALQTPITARLPKSVSEAQLGKQHPELTNSLLFSGAYSVPPPPPPPPPLPPTRTESLPKIPTLPVPSSIPNTISYMNNINNLLPKQEPSISIIKSYNPAKRKKDDVRPAVKEDIAPKYLGFPPKNSNTSKLSVSSLLKEHRSSMKSDADVIDISINPVKACNSNISPSSLKIRTSDTIEISVSSKTSPQTNNSVIKNVTSLPKSSPVSLSFMNIPDCISVTPSLQRQSPTSVAPTPNKPIMSLKQRILQDTMQGNVHSLTKTVNSNVSSNSYNNIRLDSNEENADIRDSLTPNNIKKMPVENGSKQVDVKKLSSEKSFSPSFIPEDSKQKQKQDLAAKEAEQRLNEETAAAADFLSQIINDSLVDLSEPGREIYHRTSGHATPVAINPVSTSEVKILHKEKTIPTLPVNQSAENHSDQVAIPHWTDEREESVQMEMDRVVKELMQLQSHNQDGDKKDVRKIPNAAASVISAVSSNSTKVSLLKQSTSKPALVTSCTNKMSFGFQDAFQRHLFMSSNPENCVISDSETTPVQPLTSEGSRQLHSSD